MAKKIWIGRQTDKERKKSKTIKKESENEGDYSKEGKEGNVDYRIDFLWICSRK